jgi:Zn-dependent protease
MVILFLLSFGLFFFSVMIHEIAHGVVAESLGDPTARLMGRITLNPLKHVDPFGTIFLPLLLILTNSPVVLGWAKPVPYNPLNLSKDYRYGPLKVALAGPFSNMLLTLVFSLLARLGFSYSAPMPLVAIFTLIAFMNIFLALFNLVPIPPLDGSKIFSIFFPGRSVIMIEQLGMIGILFVFVFIYFFSGFLFGIAASLVEFLAGKGAFFIFQSFFFGGS